MSELERLRDIADLASKWTGSPNAAKITLLRGTLYDAIALIDKLEARERWQPMETAPKDGTWILVHCPDGIAPSVVAWSENDYAWLTTDDDEAEDRELRVLASQDWNLAGWMPLPAPPTTENERSE